MRQREPYDCAVGSETFVRVRGRGQIRCRTVTVYRRHWGRSRNGIARGMEVKSGALVSPLCQLRGDLDLFRGIHCLPTQTLAEEAAGGRHTLGGCGVITRVLLLRLRWCWSLRLAHALAYMVACSALSPHTFASRTPTAALNKPFTH